MKKQTVIPVYLITGFLDSGKSNFLKFTMQEDYFNDGTKTLVIACEDGEEEYEQKVLKKSHAALLMCEEQESLTPDFLQKAQTEYKPERVLIEYNGMWDLKQILTMALPENWQFYQVITICDGEHFNLYLNNAKNLAMDLLRNTDMVIFNRCDPENKDLLIQYQRATRAVNPKCDMVFESKAGAEIEPPEPDLPYKLEDDPIVISDENYTTLYMDLTEHHDRYHGKRVEFLIQIMQKKEFPKNLFVGGRRAMTCCVQDIQFLPYIFLYDQAKTLKNGEWATVKATVRWEFHEAYQEEGPVFYVEEVKPAAKPEEEVVNF